METEVIKVTNHRRGASATGPASKTSAAQRTSFRGRRSEDARSEDTSSEDARSEDARSEDATQRTPGQGTPLRRCRSEDVSSEDTSSEDASSEDTSSEDATQRTPGQGTPLREMPLRGRRSAAARYPDEKTPFVLDHGDTYYSLYSEREKCHLQSVSPEQRDDVCLTGGVFIHLQLNSSFLRSHRTCPGLTGRVRVSQDVSGLTGRVRVSQDVSGSHRTCSGLTGRVQVSQDVFRSHRTCPGLTGVSRFTGRVRVSQDVSRSHRTCSGLTGRVQVSQDVSRSHRTCSGLTGRVQVSQDVFRSHRTCSGLTGRVQVSQDVFRSHRTCPGLTGCVQVSQDVFRSHRTCPGLTGRVQVIDHRLFPVFVALLRPPRRPSVGVRPFITHGSRRVHVLHPNLEIRGQRKDLRSHPFIEFTHTCKALWNLLCLIVLTDLSGGGSLHALSASRRISEDERHCGVSLKTPAASFMVLLPSGCVLTT
ncbi:unnamed protein product [Pleuronectes platessa]|uniref:Uncharacterized protein n=1 Tax=Pleuronectes platessa TaxID=8262 RepID=A0A9N7U3P9_PLEPL|nr:unnamed protein product [Pleuronectes platessa]